MSVGIEGETVHAEFWIEDDQITVVGIWAFIQHNPSINFLRAFGDTHVLETCQDGWNDPMLMDVFERDPVCIIELRDGSKFSIEIADK